jgi:hypothetical protein
LDYVGRIERVVMQRTRKWILPGDDSEEGSDEEDENEVVGDQELDLLEVDLIQVPITKCYGPSPV